MDQGSCYSREMDVKRVQTSVKAGFGYGEAEAALAAALGVDAAEQRGWLRGRITNLRRLGLSPREPGSGRRGGAPIEYSREDLDRWLVSLEIQAAGIDPTIAVKFIKERWDPPEAVLSIRELVGKARKSKRPETDVHLTVSMSDFITRNLPSVGWLAGNEKHMRGFLSWLSEPRHRAAVFNLSARLRVLDTALAGDGEGGAK
jgi:hypothetical protein